MAASSFQAIRSSNAVASAVDSARPIIDFGVFFAVLASRGVGLDERAGESIHRCAQSRKDQRAVFSDRDDARAVDLVNQPEQRHVDAKRNA